MRYNEHELNNGVVIFSSDEKPGKMPCWGLYDKSTGKNLVNPTYDKITAWGKMNDEPVVFLSLFGKNKLYLVNKHKIIFNDDSNIIGKNFEYIPQLHSDSLGDLYYIENNGKYQIVDENEKVYLESEAPFEAPVQVYDNNGHAYLLTARKIYDLTDNNAKVDDFDGDKPKYALKINGHQMLIISDFFGTTYLYNLNAKKKIGKVNWDIKEYNIITHNAFYAQLEPSLIYVYDEKGLINKLSTKGYFGGLIKINDDLVIVSDIYYDCTYNAYTGKKIADYFIVSKDDNILKIVRGNLTGIADAETFKIIVPPIFRDITNSNHSYMCVSINKETFEYDIKKGFSENSKRNISKYVFIVGDKL